MNPHQQWESDRDLGAELLASVQQMKSDTSAKEHRVALSTASEARQALGLSQSAFAALIGVSKRTLQEWEQGRRNPGKTAQALLRIAATHPDVLRELQSS